MNLSPEKEQIFKKIADNEKRSRWRLIIAILIYSLLALTTIYYAIKFNIEREQTEMLNKQLNMTIDSVERIKQNFEEVRAELLVTKDSLLILVESSKTTKNALKDEKVAEQIERAKRAGYIIYLQETGRNGRSLARKLQTLLKEQGYSVPDVEHFSRSFKSRISYFHEEDRQIVEEISSTLINFLKEQNIKFDESIFLPTKLNLQAPVKQVEIWINFNSLDLTIRLD